MKAETHHAHTPNTKASVTARGALRSFVKKKKQKAAERIPWQRKCDQASEGPNTMSRPKAHGSGVRNCTQSENGSSIIFVKYAGSFVVSRYLRVGIQALVGVFVEKEHRVAVGGVERQHYSLLMRLPKERGTERYGKRLWPPPCLSRGSRGMLSRAASAMNGSMFRTHKYGHEGCQN